MTEDRPDEVSGDLWYPWDAWVWDTAANAWKQVTQFGPEPTAWKTETHGGVPHQVPDYSGGLSPVDLSGIGSGLSKTRAEVVASQYATVGGQDVYIETAAERDARASGLYRDTFGYYRLEGSHRTYVTGIDAESGRRFHYADQIDPDTGHRKIVWDDSDRWETPTGDRASLLAARNAAKSKLQRLRERYQQARADDWTTRNNLLVRIRNQEDTVNAILRALGKDPKPAVTFELTAAQHPRFEGGIKVDIDYARWRDGEPLSFSNPLREISAGDRIIVRASITVGERKWKPGMLAQPDMCRVTWTRPDSYEWADTAKADGTDEYINQRDGLVLMRDTYAPSTGNTYTGRGSKNSFTVKAELYEINLVTLPDHTHDEGVDGAITAIFRTVPPPGTDPGDGSGGGNVGTTEQQLIRFMEAIRWVESSCDYFQVNSIGCVGAYQFCHWNEWSINKWGYVRDLTPSNQDIMAHDKMLNYFKKTNDWARVAWMWHSGYGRWDDNWGSISHGTMCYVNCVMRMFDGRPRIDTCLHGACGPAKMGTCPSDYYGATPGGGCPDPTPGACEEVPP